MDTSVYNQPFEINIDNMYKFIIDNKYQTITDKDIRDIIINSNLQIEYEKGDIKNTYETFDISSILPDNTISTSTSTSTPTRRTTLRRFKSPQGVEELEESFTKEKVDQTAESFSKHEKPKNILQKAIRDYFDIKQTTDLITLSDSEIQFKLDQENETKKTLQIVIEHILNELKQNAQITIQKSQSQSQSHEQYISHDDSQDETVIDDNEIVENEIKNKINNIFERKQPESIDDTEDIYPATPIQTHDNVTKTIAKKWINPEDSQKSPKKSPKRYKSTEQEDEEKSDDGEYGLEDMPQVETLVELQLKTENNYINTFLLALPRDKVDKEIEGDTPMGMVLQVMRDKGNNINQTGIVYINKLFDIEIDDGTLDTKEDKDYEYSLTIKSQIKENDNISINFVHLIDTMSQINKLEQLLDACFPVDINFNATFDIIENIMCENIVNSTDIEDNEDEMGGGTILIDNDEQHKLMDVSQDENKIIEDLTMLLSFLKQRAEIPHDFPVPNIPTYDRFNYDRNNDTKDMIKSILKNFIGYFKDNASGLGGLQNIYNKIYHTQPETQLSKLIKNLSTHYEQEDIKENFSKPYDPSKLKKYEWEYFEQIMKYLKNLKKDYNIKKKLRFNKCIRIWSSSKSGNNKNSPIERGSDLYQSLIYSGYIKRFIRKNNILEEYFICDEMLRPYRFHDNKAILNTDMYYLDQTKMKYNMEDTVAYTVNFASPIMGIPPSKVGKNTNIDIYNESVLNQSNIKSYNMFTFLDPSSTPKLVDTIKTKMGDYFLEPKKNNNKKTAAIRTFEHCFNKYRNVFKNPLIKIADVYFSKSNYSNNEYDLITIERLIRDDKQININLKFSGEGTTRYNSKQSIELTMLKLKKENSIDKNDDTVNKFIYPYMKLLGADFDPEGKIRNTPKNLFLLISIKGEGDACQVMYMNYLNQIERQNETFISTVDKNVFSHAALMDVPCFMGNTGMKIKVSPSVFKKYLPNYEREEYQEWFLFGNICENLIRQYINIDFGEYTEREVIDNIKEYLNKQHPEKEKTNSYTCLSTYGLTYLIDDMDKETTEGKSQEQIEDIKNHRIDKIEKIKKAIKRTFTEVKESLISWDIIDEHDSIDLKKVYIFTTRINNKKTVFNQHLFGSIFRIKDGDDLLKLIDYYEKLHDIWSEFKSYVELTYNLKDSINYILQIKEFKVNIFLDFIDEIRTSILQSGKRDEYDILNENFNIDKKTLKIQDKINSLFKKSRIKFNGIINKIKEIKLIYDSFRRDNYNIKECFNTLKVVNECINEEVNNKTTEIDDIHYNIQYKIDRILKNTKGRRERTIFERSSNLRRITHSIEGIKKTIENTFLSNKRKIKSSMDGGSDNPSFSLFNFAKNRKNREEPTSLPEYEEYEEDEAIPGKMDKFIERMDELGMIGYTEEEELDDDFYEIIDIEEEENESNQQVTDLNNEIATLTEQNNVMKQNLEQLIYELTKQVKENKEIITELEQEKNSLITQLEQKEYNLQQSKNTEEEKKEDFNRINIRLQELTIQTTRQEKLIEEYKQLIKEIKNTLELRDKQTKRSFNVDNNDTSGDKDRTNIVNVNRPDKIGHIIENFEKTYGNEEKEVKQVTKSNEKSGNEELRVAEQVTKSNEKSGNEGNEELRVAEQVTKPNKKSRNEGKEEELEGGSRIRSSSKTRHNRVNKKKSKKTNKNRGWMW
jgi:hypothetical protein